MILHRLIGHHLKYGDDAAFYRMQAEDAITWIETCGRVLAPSLRTLDLGCGHGVFGKSLMQKGCQVTFADVDCQLEPELRSQPFLSVDLDKDDYRSLGTYPFIVCSNVFEHLASPQRFLSQIGQTLEPGGWLYLSWTNLLSPWGGHDFSPFHYLGPVWGPRLYDRLIGKPRIHQPFETLYPTYIGQTLDWIRQEPHLECLHCVPRYYPEFAWITQCPLIREFLAWNTALLIRKRP